MNIEAIRRKSIYSSFQFLFTVIPWDGDDASWIGEQGTGQALEGMGCYLFASSAEFRTRICLHGDTG